MVVVVLACLVGAMFMVPLFSRVAKADIATERTNILAEIAKRQCATAAPEKVENCIKTETGDKANIDKAKSIASSCTDELASIDQADQKTKDIAWSSWLQCVNTSIININPEASATGTPTPIKNDCNGADLNEENCEIVRYLKIAINTLSALAGVAIIGSIIVGGIQYSTSADDPQAVAKAKGRIMNALIALLLFTFGYGILMWLIPGGLL